MIKFFKKIRQSLLSEGKTGKYLKYAIGEIILVVIGILIALSINNWNEQRKLDEITKVILKQIQLDILNNMGTAEYAYMRFNHKDSIFWTMKQKKLTPSDFAGDNKLIYKYATSTQWSMDMKNKGFENLKSHPGIKPGEYAALINDLEWLEGEIMYFNENIENIDQQLEDHFAYRRANFDWYSSEFWTGEVSDAELEFYAYNPIFKNHIALYSEYMYQALSASNNYTVIAFEVYSEIAAILGQKEDELPEEIKNYYTDIPTDSLTAFTGRYVLHYAPPLNSKDNFSRFDSLTININAENKLILKKHEKDTIYEKDLSIRSLNMLEEIHRLNRVHYSINEDGYLVVKYLYGLPYLFKKIKD